MSLFHFSLHRWWQNMGFGIQSKTDYAFLHDVLRERLPYYIYDTLWKEYPQYNKKAHRQAQLLFRICNHCRNERIMFVGSFNELDRKAIEQALPYKAEFTKASYDKIIADIIIISGIYKENANKWSGFTQGKCITFDMVDLGIAIFDTKRFPEHYKILSI